MYSLTFRMTFPNGVFKDNIFEHFDFCYKDFLIITKGF